MGKGVSRSQEASRKSISSLWYFFLLCLSAPLNCKAQSWPPCACIDNHLSCTLGLSVLLQNRTCIQSSLVNVRGIGLQYFPGDLNTFGSAQVLNDCINDTACYNNEALRDICALSVLDISHNNMKSMPHLPYECSLAVINAADNNIYTIEEPFSRCQTLEGLNLAENNISVLPKGSFWGLSKLRVLELSKNPLQKLSNTVFRDLSELEILHLSGVGLLYLTEDIFANLHKLFILDLSHNNIMFLRRDTFVGLRNLHILDLHNNHLRYMAPGVFREQIYLLELDLDSNRMKYFYGEAFVGLSSLKKLWIQNNTLMEVPALGSLFPRLQTAYLANNSITSLSKQQAFSAACGSSRRSINLRGNLIHPRRLCWTLLDAKNQINKTNLGSGCYRLSVRTCKDSTLEYCTILRRQPSERSISAIASANTRISYIVSEQKRRYSWSVCKYIKDMPLVILILPAIGLILLGKEILRKRQPTCFDTYQKDVERY